MSSCTPNAHSSHFPRALCALESMGLPWGLFACTRANTNYSSLCQHPWLHPLHLLLRLPKITGVVVTAVISKPGLSFHLIYYIVVVQTPTRVLVLQHCGPAEPEPSFDTTPVPGRPQDDRRNLLAPQVFPYSHASRVFPHRRHKHSCAARHTTQIAFTCTYPTSSPTDRWRRTSFIASLLSRRHSERYTTTNTRRRKRGAQKNVYFHFLKPRHGPHRQLPHTRLTRERPTETLKGRAAKARQICPQALLSQQPPQLLQQLSLIPAEPAIPTKPKHILRRDFTATSSSRRFQASRFSRNHHTADAPARQVRQLVQAQEQHVYV